jgi:ABC-type branched-subunit amino acid transport system substrate-binding protein
VLHSRVTSLTMIGLLSLAVAACGSSSSDSGSSGGSASGGGNAPTQLGFIVDKTGALAPIGNGYARGVEVAEALWNADPANRKVKVDSCDSQSTGDGAIACYQRLRSSADAISGPSLFVGLASVRGIAAKGTVPLVSGAPLVNPPAGSAMFQTIPTIDDGVEAAFAHFKADGKTDVALLTSNDEPGNLAKKAATSLAGTAGIELVTQQVFDPTAQNLAAQAENIAKTKPDAVLAWTAGPQLITALRALKAARVDVPVMLNYASMSTALLAQAGKEATSNILFFGTRAFASDSITDPAFKERVQAFDAEFKKRFKAAPDLTAYDSADTLYVIGTAAKKAADPAAIRKVLESGAALPGVLFPEFTFSAEKHVGATGAEQFDILRWQPAEQTWELVE